MNKQLALTALASSILLTACGGGGGGGGEAPRATTSPEINVAAASNGALATANYNNTTARQLIDGDIATSWISDDGSTITVQFGITRSITRITLRKVDSSVTVGTHPDILVELSENGSTWTASDMSVYSGGIPCTRISSGRTVITCDMAARNARAIRVTSQNGKSFEFQELEVTGR